MRSKMENLLKTGMENLKSMVRYNFERDGHLAPIAFLNIDGKIQIMLTLFNSEEDKNVFSQFLIKLIQQKKLKEYVMTTEAWCGLGAAAMAHKREGKSLQDFEGRKEIIHLHYSSPKEEYVFFAEITRPDEKNPVLGEWDGGKMNQNEELAVMGSPRFSNLWQQAVPTSNN